MAISAKFPCPSCGHEVFSESPGSFEICPVCYWEDDHVQLVFPDLAGGANRVSLLESQRNVSDFGACEMRFKKHVRLPLATEPVTPGWRPLDLRRDRFLQWESHESHRFWNSIEDATGLCLYYWQDDYFLAK
jgi:hypothetical protein